MPAAIANAAAAVNVDRSVINQMMSNTTAVASEAQWERNQHRVRWHGRISSRGSPWRPANLGRQAPGGIPATLLGIPRHASRQNAKTEASAPIRWLILPLDWRAVAAALAMLAAATAQRRRPRHAPSIASMTSLISSRLVDGRPACESERTRTPAQPSVE